MRLLYRGEFLDTGRDEKIADRDNGLQEDDNLFIRETIFKTKTGTCYRYTLGGPYTRLGIKRPGQSRVYWGEEIKPMTKESVQDWLKSNKTQGKPVLISQ